MPERGRPWIRTIAPTAPARLLCLSYAGGGSADFRTWRGALLPAIDLCPVVLPGREHRLSERTFDDVDALVGAMLPGLLPVLRLAPYAVYGHSMGAWVGFELIRALRRIGAPQPLHLFVGARRAPHRPSRHAPLSHLPDDQFVDAVQDRYGGIPEALRSSPDLLALFLPALRADMTLLDRYRYRAEPPLEIPITALFGTEDPLDDPADVRAWVEHGDRVAIHPIAGGHFFHREAPDDIADRLNSALRSAIPHG